MDEFFHTVNCTHFRIRFRGTLMCGLIYHNRATSVYILEKNKLPLQVQRY